MQFEATPPVAAQLKRDPIGLLGILCSQAAVRRDQHGAYSVHGRHSNIALG